MTEPTADQRAAIKEHLFGLGEPLQGSPDQVILILCASRSGSSTTFRALRKSPDVVAPPGELEPYLNLTGTARRADGAHVAPKPRDKSLRELRFLARADLWQWSSSSIAPGQWRLRRKIQWPNQVFPYMMVSPQKMMAQPGVDEGCYDGADDPTRPPLKIEEPPYIRPAPCDKPDGLAGKTVLLKTPQHTYRRWIADLFPNADFKTLHLYRNPAASVNGLIDGWLHQHFTSHEGGPAFADWWSFDIPLAPLRMHDMSLPQIALTQWAKANEYALRREPDWSLPFEHVLSSPTGAIRRICSTFGIKLPKDSTLPQTMSTAPPDPDRWRKREGLIKNICQRPRVQRIVDQLPYMNDEPWKLSAEAKMDS
jgi:hypothetical protein